MLIALNLLSQLFYIFFSRAILWNSVKRDTTFNDDHKKNVGMSIFLFFLKGGKNPKLRKRVL